MILKGFKSFIGDRPIDEITTACIDEYIAQRLSTVSASTINRELTVIKAMFGKAIRWGLCKTSPAREVKKLREVPGRVRYLVEDEWPWLTDAVKAGPWWLYPACAFARYAGLRRGEILRLRWKDMDLANALILVQNTKANRNEVVPINASLLDVLWVLSRDQEYVLLPAPGLL